MSEQQKRAVMVGLGGISPPWLKTLSEAESVDIVGLVDIAPGLAKERKKEYALTNAFADTDLKLVLDKTKPDLLFDLTTPESHHAVTMEALKRGIHVLGEKPMADSMDHAREMVSASQKAGKLYAVIQNYRYNNSIRSLRNYIESGAIGDVTTLCCDFFLAPKFGGFREQMDHVLLLDMAIHQFDAARFIAGSDPVSVLCHDWNPNGSWYADGASAIATFEMTEGVVFNYRGSWCAHGFATGWNASWRIIGTKGSVKWDETDRLSADIIKESKGFISTYETVDLPEVDIKGKNESHKSVIHEFLDCVRDGKKPETVCTDNINSLAMVLGAIESIEKESKVKIQI